MAKKIPEDDFGNLSDDNFLSKAQMRPGRSKI